MKRILTILVTTVAVVFLALPVMAKKYNVPTNICFSYEDEDATYYFTFGTKKGESIRYMEEQKTFYTLQGLENVSGNWNLINGDAQTDDLGRLYINAYSGFLKDLYVLWDMSTQTGQLNYADLDGNSDTLDLTEIDCRDVQLHP